MNLQIKYHHKSKEVENKLSQLRRIVKKHNQFFNNDLKNTGYLIDLINLENRIDEVLNFTLREVN